MKHIKPPIRYFGGKSNMIYKILTFFPNPESYDTYLEVFGGSYSLGLSIDHIPPIQIYNDLEKNVYSLYKVLSDPDMYREFKEKCDLVLYSEDLRSEFKENLKCDDLSLVERAFYFFYVNRTSHNGIGGFSRNTCIRRGMCKSISDFLSSIDRLDELHNRLSRVIVTNTDGIKLIEKYNTPNVFLYCDPPYEQSTRASTRYKVDMDREGHIKFLDAVINSKAKILISGYDCQLYDRLSENGFKKVNFEVKTIDGNFKPKTKTEYLYYNYVI